MSDMPMFYNVYDNILKQQPRAGLPAGADALQYAVHCFLSEEYDFQQQDFDADLVYEHFVQHDQKMKSIRQAFQQMLEYADGGMKESVSELQGQFAEYVKEKLREGYLNFHPDMYDPYGGD